MAMKRDTSKLGRVSVEPEVRERRGERVLISISIQVRGLREDNTKVDEGAEAIVVSRFGALLRMGEDGQRSDRNEQSLERRGSFPRGLDRRETTRRPLGHRRRSRQPQGRLLGHPVPGPKAEDLAIQASSNSMAVSI